MFYNNRRVHCLVCCAKICFRRHPPPAPCTDTTLTFVCGTVRRRLLISHSMSSLCRDSCETENQGARYPPAGSSGRLCFGLLVRWGGLLCEKCGIEGGGGGLSLSLHVFFSLLSLLLLPSCLRSLPRRRACLEFLHFLFPLRRAGRLHNNVFWLNTEHQPQVYFWSNGDSIAQSSSKVTRTVHIYKYIVYVFRKQAQGIKVWNRRWGWGFGFHEG